MDSPTPSSRASSSRTCRDCGRQGCQSASASRPHRSPRRPSWPESVPRSEPLLPGVEQLTRHWLPLPTSASLRTRVIERAVPAGPTYLQSRVEHDMSPPAASAKDGTICLLLWVPPALPQDGVWALLLPPGCRVWLAEALHNQLLSQVSPQGRGRACGQPQRSSRAPSAQAQLTLTSYIRRSALLPGCPTPSGACAPSASGCTWGGQEDMCGSPPVRLVPQPRQGLAQGPNTWTRRLQPSQE